MSTEITTLGIFGWVIAALITGWLLGLATVQMWDDRNWYREQAAEADRRAKLDEARKQQVTA